MNSDEIQALVDQVENWHQKFELAPGVITPGAYNARELLDRLDLPEDMSGMRVLDIGANDGFFTATCALRGASVVALDYRDKSHTGFWVTERVFDIDVEFINANVFDVPALNLGTFDIVLFLGILYHLPDPYYGLARCAEICTGRIYIETECVQIEGIEEPVMRFFPRDSLNNDITNFWAPNPACLRAMIEDCGFRMLWDFYRVRRAIACAERVDDDTLEMRRKLAYGMFPD